MARTLALQKNGEDPVGAPDFTLPVSILAQIIESLKVDIVAQTIPKLEINIKSIDSGVVFNVAQSGDWTVNVQTPAGVQLNVNIANINEGVVFNVAQSGDWTVNVVESGTWTVNVQTPAGVQLNVNIAAQSIPVLNMHLASVGDVTLNVHITGTPTINVRTSGGANIVIDQLTQGAVTERRWLLQNHATPDVEEWAFGDTREGKFFPRGCRGYINFVNVYLRNPDSVERWVKIFLSPFPGAGVVYSYTLTLPPGFGPAWYGYSLKRMWNYDSMFIWFQTETTAPLLYTSDSPPDDRYTSIDKGLTWTVNMRRYLITVDMAGSTVGDLPVTGTINNIAIPSTSDTRLYTVLPVTTTETLMKEIWGMGTVKWLEFDIEPGTNSHHTICRVYCDGNKAFEKRFSTLNYDGYGPTTPGVSLTYYGVNDRCHLSLLLEFSFRHSLRITMQTDVETLDGIVEGLVNLVR